MNLYFTPNEEESKLIEQINSLNHIDFTLVRMTVTMLDKSIIDAHQLFRKILFDNGIIDFNSLLPGGEKELINTIILSDQIIETKTSFYRPKTKEGDPRFWVYGLKKFVKFGDLIYLTVQKNMLIVIPINSCLNEQNLSSVFDDITKNETVIQLRKKLESLTYSNFIESVSLYSRAPKDVGLTLERFLNVKVNSLKTPDYLGKIELKSKRDGQTKDSLFSKIPDKDISKYKTVKDIILEFGYRDEENDRIALYNNIITKPNTQGLYLEVNNDKLILFQKYSNNKEFDDVCAWHYKTLKDALETKHPTTLWVEADEMVIDNKIHFRYKNFELTTKPVFTEFISLIERDLINFDWKGHVKDGKKRDHGPGFRISKQNRKFLFKTLINI
jgi:hypothetical protein